MKNGENVPHLEINEVVLAHFNIVNNDYQHDSRACMHLLQINRLVNYYMFHQKNLFFKKPLILNFHTLNYGLLIKTLHLWR